VKNIGHKSLQSAKENRKKTRTKIGPGTGFRGRIARNLSMWRAQGKGLRHFRQEIKDLAHDPEK
jgi:hypothetical protein